MKYTNLINVKLKDDLLNDLFETYDTEVIYNYDRNQENTDDQYFAEIRELGLLFVFNQNQDFTTLFITPKISDSYNPIENNIQKFTSKNEVLNFTERENIKYDQGNIEFLGEIKDWIKLYYNDYSIHYEFVDQKLKMITLQTGIA